MRFRFSVYLGLVVGLLLILNSFSLQQKLRVLTFTELEPHLFSQDDTIYIINFWASWCKPCVAELPAFVRYYKDNRDKNIALLLVSLDLPSQVETRLVPFLKEHNIDAPVVVLDDPDFNEWINKVDVSWSGAIPATLIVSKDKRMFFENSFTYEELSSVVTKNFFEP